MGGARNYGTRDHDKMYVEVWYRGEPRLLQRVVPRRRYHYCAVLSFCRPSFETRTDGIPFHRLELRTLVLSGELL